MACRRSAGKLGTSRGRPKKSSRTGSPRTSLMLISKRCDVTVSDGWPEAPRSIGRLPRDSVHERFGALLERARGGELDHWADTPRGRLALIIVLDQFSRNIYRGSPLSYAQDKKALKL